MRQGGAPRVLTIGHSSRGLSEFIGILLRYGVEVLVDVRRLPGSRRVPWFRRSVLERALPEHGIAYLWLGDLLGGLGVDYARYVETAAYRRGVGALAALACSGARVAVMCRERWWMRCHRAFIADTLHELGFEVLHVVDLGHAERHRRLGVAPRWARAAPPCQS